MRLLRSLVLSGAVVLAGTAAAHAGVTVTFDHPERYTDAGNPYGPVSRDAAMRGIGQHLERLAARYLRPDQVLTIDVLDIDLAGRKNPLRAFAYDVRVRRQETWPRITLRYTLTQGGTVVASAEETVTDQSYLDRPGLARSPDPLRYEKAMLDDWFRARFVERRPPQG